MRRGNGTYHAVDHSKNGFFLEADRKGPESSPGKVRKTAVFFRHLQQDDWEETS
jgi:hypothetical protein